METPKDFRRRLELVQADIVQKLEIRLDPDATDQIRRGDVARIGERLARRHRPEIEPVGVVDSGRALGNVRQEIGRLQRVALESERIDEGFQRRARRTRRTREVEAPRVLPAKARRADLGDDAIAVLALGDHDGDLPRARVAKAVEIAARQPRDAGLDIKVDRGVNTRVVGLRLDASVAQELRIAECEMQRLRAFRRLYRPHRPKLRLSERGLLAIQRPLAGERVDRVRRACRGAFHAAFARRDSCAPAPEEQLQAARSRPRTGPRGAYRNKSAQHAPRRGCRRHKAQGADNAKARPRGHDARRARAPSSPLRIC